MDLAVQSYRSLENQLLIGRLRELQTVIDAQYKEVRTQSGLVSSIPSQIEVEGNNHLNKRQAEEQGRIAAATAQRYAADINAILTIAGVDLQTIDIVLNALDARLQEANEAQRQHDIQEAAMQQAEALAVVVAATPPVAGSSADLEVVPPVLFSSSRLEQEGTALGTLRGLLGNLLGNFSSLTRVTEPQGDSLEIEFSERENASDTSLVTAIEKCGFSVEKITPVESENNSAYRISINETSQIKAKHLSPSAFRTLLAEPKAELSVSCRASAN